MSEFNISEVFFIYLAFSLSTPSSLSNSLFVAIQVLSNKLAVSYFCYHKSASLSLDSNTYLDCCSESYRSLHSPLSCISKALVFLCSFCSSSKRSCQTSLESYSPSINSFNYYIFSLKAFLLVSNLRSRPFLLISIMSFAFVKAILLCSRSSIS